MNFYPVIITRTGYPRGFDFQEWAAPKNLDPQLRILARYAMNEDYYSTMTRARRVYYKTDDFVFWGVALHDEWFVPQETIARLQNNWRELGDDSSLIERQTEHLKQTRGFWGGLIYLKGFNWEELAPFVAASLTKDNRRCELAPEIRVKLEEQSVNEAERYGTKSRPCDFYGESDFPFAARMFQYFVEPYWNQKSPLIEPETRCWNDVGTYARDEYDLRFFASESVVRPEYCSEQREFAGKRTDYGIIETSAKHESVETFPREYKRTDVESIENGTYTGNSRCETREIRTLLAPELGEQAEERALQKAIFSECKTCVVGMFEDESLARQIARDVPETRVVWVQGINETIEVPKTLEPELEPDQQFVNIVENPDNESTQTEETNDNFVLHKTELATDFSEGFPVRFFRKAIDFIWSSWGVKASDETKHRRQEQEEEFRQRARLKRYGNETIDRLNENNSDSMDFDTPQDFNTGDSKPKRKKGTKTIVVFSLPDSKQ